MTPAREPPTEAVAIRARVVSGIRGMARWVRWNADVYERATGVRLYPGSLNVVSDQPWRIGGCIRLEPDAFDVGGVGMSIVPCEIDGIPAFILRTDKNNHPVARTR